MSTPPKASAAPATNPAAPSALDTSAAGPTASPPPAPADAAATAARRPLIPRSITPTLLGLATGARGKRGCTALRETRPSVRTTATVTTSRATDDEGFRRYRATGDREVRNALIQDHRWL